MSRALLLLLLLLLLLPQLLMLNAQTFKPKRWPIVRRVKFLK